MSRSFDGGAFAWIRIYADSLIEADGSGGASLVEMLSYELNELGSNLRHCLCLRSDMVFVK